MCWALEARLLAVVMMESILEIMKGEETEELVEFAESHICAAITYLIYYNLVHLGIFLGGLVIAMRPCNIGVERQNRIVRGLFNV